MGIIEEYIERFLERYEAHELVDRYGSELYEMLESCYTRGVKDGQEEYRENFQEHLDEAWGEGQAEGYDDGHKAGNREVNVDIYKTGYIQGFDDASNGRPTKVKDAISHFGGLFVDLDVKEEDK